jgi:hypothetical protein
MTYLLKARIVEPEKQLLLANGFEKHSLLRNSRETSSDMTSITRQQILNEQE